MTYSVRQLKADSINPEVGVAQLVSNAYMVAVLLDDVSAMEWFQNELEGYSNFESIPSYRTLPARCIAIAEDHQPIPINIPTKLQREGLKSMTLSQDLAQLEKLVSKGDHAHVKLFDGDLQNTFMQLSDGSSR